MARHSPAQKIKSEKSKTKSKMCCDTKLRSGLKEKVVIRPILCKYEAKGTRNPLQRRQEGTTQGRAKKG